MTQQSNDQFNQLNQLLKLKRYEKPSADFWNKFDRELKQKAYQAFLKKEHPLKLFIKNIVLFRNPALSLPIAALFVFSSVLATQFRLPSHSSNPELEEINKIIQSNQYTELVCQNLKMNDSNSLSTGIILNQNVNSISFKPNTLY